MRGGPYESLETKYMTPDDIWNLVKDNVAKGNLLTAGSKQSEDGSDKHNDKWGIVMSHAYTVIDALTLSNGMQLVKLRNPHASDCYRGAYGAESPLWTEKLKKEIPDATNADDGYIYLPKEQVKASFASIGINYNADKMHKDYYLKLGDKSKNQPKNGTATKMYKACGEDCLLHEIHVVSTVAQKIYISLSMWNEKTQMPVCQDQGEGKKHSLYPSPQDKYETIGGKMGGDFQWGPYEF